MDAEETNETRSVVRCSAPHCYPIEVMGPSVEDFLRMSVGPARTEALLASRVTPEEITYVPPADLDLRQVAFDEALEGAGVLGDSEYGASAEELSEALARRRLEIAGMRLRGSTSVPDIDARCGFRFTYRELIECGETQARLGLANIPRNPETFNALNDLAIKLLDPLVEYFGSIQFTYGFCSLELGRHIKARVAPALDQHAAHELNR